MFTKTTYSDRGRCKSLFSNCFKSGRRDLNPRPPEPHSGALPDCATSRCHFPGNPHPVNSQQVQDAQTHSWCSATSEWDKLLLQPDPYNPLCVYASARLAVREDTDPA